MQGSFRRDLRHLYRHSLSIGLRDRRRHRVASNTRYERFHGYHRDGAAARKFIRAPPQRSPPFRDIPTHPRCLPARPRQGHRSHHRDHRPPRTLSQIRSGCPVYPEFWGYGVAFRISGQWRKPARRLFSWRPFSASGAFAPFADRRLPAPPVLRPLWRWTVCSRRADHPFLGPL